MKAAEVRALVDDQFFEIRRQLDLQLQRTGQLQVQIDRIHNRTGEVQSMLDLVHGLIKKLVVHEWGTDLAAADGPPLPPNPSSTNPS
jgi:hypothetical protein